MALAFDNPQLIKESAATGRNVEWPMPLVSQVSTAVDSVGTGTRLLRTKYQFVPY